jgi:16S rRNA (guanine(966)-N(2))-methyltransferase RsmD
MKRKTSRKSAGEKNIPRSTDSSLRIIGGDFRGRRIRYSGDPHVRPMKDRVREALFNLVGPSVKGTHAIDLFAGTGALAFEALSRGAASATAIERHFPTARIIQENARHLGVTERVELVTNDTFIWARRAEFPSGRPWLVLCSPPYRLYVERADEVSDLIGRLLTAAPAKTIFVVEAIAAWDWNLLPLADQWDVREYSPAIVGLLRNGGLQKHGEESGTTNRG